MLSYRQCVLSKVNIRKVTCDEICLDLNFLLALTCKITDTLLHCQNLLWCLRTWELFLRKVIMKVVSLILQLSVYLSYLAYKTKPFFCLGNQKPDILITTCIYFYLDSMKNNYFNTQAYLPLWQEYPEYKMTNSTSWKTF